MIQLYPDHCFHIFSLNRGLISFKRLSVAILKNLQHISHQSFSFCSLAECLGSPKNHFEKRFRLKIFSFWSVQQNPVLSEKSGGNLIGLILNSNSFRFLTVCFICCTQGPSSKYTLLPSPYTFGRTQLKDSHLWSEAPLNCCLLWSLHKVHGYPKIPTCGNKTISGLA